MSSSVLRQRLNELAAAGLVDTVESGPYQLTNDGWGLLALLTPLKEWADDWGRRFDSGAGARS